MNGDSIEIALIILLAVVVVVIIVWIFDETSPEGEDKQIAAINDPMRVSEEDMKRVYANMDKVERVINLSVKDLESMLNLIQKHKANTLQEILELQQLEFIGNATASDAEIMTKVFLLYNTMKEIIAKILRESFFSKNIDLEYSLYLQTIDKVRNQIKRKAQNDLILNNSKYFSKVDQIALKLKDLYEDFLFVDAFQELIDVLYKEENPTDKNQ